MDWNFKNGIPIYTQIVDELTMRIASGAYAPGEKLDSVRDMAMDAGVNPNTMQKALLELENEGLVYTERTNGKFVTNNEKLIEKIKKELAKEKVNNYLKDMNNIGISYEEALRYLQELGGDK